MEALDAILSRRSIRRYTDKPVLPETVRTLLEAAMAAPSANNKQPWHFVVVTERFILDAIPKFHPYSRMLFEAPLAILVCGDTSIESHPGYIAQDCSAAVENILIAAQGLGLGAVWLGVYPREERMVGMKDLLKIPDGILPFALISFGYPAEEKPPSNRYSGSRVHHNKW
jgi:nitroreductase